MYKSGDVTPVLQVNELSVVFRQYDMGLRQRDLQVIKNLNVSINRGEVMAVAGSSGSGKSLLAHAILGILPENASVSGSMQFCGAELTPKLQEKLRGREMALVPQSVTYLDPLMRVGTQVRTAINSPASKKVKEDMQKDVFLRFGLSSKVSKFFSFQLSGGMARRVLLSSAVLSGARLIIADEPTPGLDCLAVEEVLNNLRELADDGCSVMLITHDIDTSLRIADRIAVFYAGTTLEIARAEEFKGNGEGLRHPYCKALWQALPQNGFKPVHGFQPSHLNMHEGCAFVERCPIRTEECKNCQIEMRDLRGGKVRCIHAT